MFAPPPLPNLSLQEIQARRQAKKPTNNGSPQETSPASPTPSSISLQRSDSKDSKSSRTSKRPSLFGKDGKLRITGPILRSSSSPPPGAASNSIKTASDAVNSEQTTNFSPTPFAESPRAAPAPPKRPVSTRPPSELFLLSGASPVLPKPATTAPISEPSPADAPPVPAKSPLRQIVTENQQSVFPTSRPQSCFTEISLDAAVKQLQISDADVSSVLRESVPDKATPTPRAFSSYSAPPAPERKNSLVVLPAPNRVRSALFIGGGSSSTTLRKVPSLRKRAAKLSGVQGAKIDKDEAAKRASAVSAKRRSQNAPESNGESTTAKKSAGISISSNGPVQMPWRRKRKGETMSMLIDDGFFPVQELIYKNRRPTSANFRLSGPSPLSLIFKDLPTTPTSIVGTPTEMYQMGPRRLQAAIRNRNLNGNASRSPLSQVSTFSAKADSSPVASPGEEISPSRLQAIPEDPGMSENSPRHSGVSTPVATEIHLRSGSIITVCPPELTAWQRSVYIQGPIKLPKPIVVPSKNSIATLEPFQEAIDQIYQDALSIPRRRSDDAIVDDFCKFFDEFGFEEISFAGDQLETADIDVDEVQELEIDSGEEPQRYSTPPLEADLASPIEKVFAAKIVVQSMMVPQPVPKPVIPPADSIEFLRVKGITRLSQSAAVHAGKRKDLESWSPEQVLPLLPLPESDSIPPPSQEEYAVEEDDQFADSGFDWDDDVEETDARSSWLGPAAVQKNHALNRGLSGREARNPVAKMRRLVQTASAIL